MECHLKDEFIHAPNDQTNEENRQFLSTNNKSKEEFIDEYKKLYYKKENAEELYLLILSDLKDAICNGNVGSVKTLGDFIEYIIVLEDKDTLSNYYNNDKNPVKNTNLVILACKSNKVKILEYLLSDGSTILANLALGATETTILPSDKDETKHNAFYYAIRSSNIELLDTLINKWPENYFCFHIRELPELLSGAYKELKLKNVLLSKEIEVYIEDRLLNLRFLCRDSVQDENCYPSNIIKRIELVLQTINLLSVEYFSARVDGQFLFAAKFIAQNIHVLKGQLKITYNVLPWDEMEFCLDCFVFYHTECQEINLFYLTTLNKGKILTHLENFGKILKKVYDNIRYMDIDTFTDLPKLTHDEVVAEIVNNYPQLKELYDNYQQIRDVHTLEKTNDYMKLAISVDPTQKYGQLIILRVLQVVGKYLKNTLEFPMLSNTTRKLLLQHLPSNTIDIIVEVSKSLSERADIGLQKSSHVNLFIGVQNDTKKISDAVTKFLYNRKIETVKILLTKIVDSENLDELKEICAVISNTELGDEKLQNCATMEHEQFEKFITKLSNSIVEKRSELRELFNKINAKINVEKTQSKRNITYFTTEFAKLKGVTKGFCDNEIGTNVVRVIKFLASRTLAHIESKILCDSLKQDAHSLIKIFKETDLDLQVPIELCNKILFFLGYESGSLRSIEELMEQLNSKYMSNPICKQNNKTLGLNSKAVETPRSSKRCNEFQAVVGMLVLDIVSALGNYKMTLNGNVLFLDNTTILTRKSLCYLLEDNNFLVNLLQSESPLTEILKAKEVTFEHAIKSKVTRCKLVRDKENHCKLVRDDPTTFNDEYNQGLIAISHHKDMFVALEEGNFEGLKSSIINGADVNGRSINGLTALHFAAKGSNLQIVKFLLNENLDANVRDMNGQTPLHIAAACGQTNIVKFFVEEVDIQIDDKDSLTGKTPLHIAAQNGHGRTVEVLLTNGANSLIRDKCSLLPLHYAIRNNHLSIVKVLLEKVTNFDSVVTLIGFTPLHFAAESGHLEIVNFLLEKNSNVNVRNYRNLTPLHAACLIGHLEVVNTLIENQANVNDSLIDGCTALHFSIEYGHQEIAKLLLKHGADVDASDQTYNNTPLHYAAKYGHVAIVKALLNHKVNVNVTNVSNMTPLYFAAKNGHMNVVVILVRNGGEVNARSNNKVTPLQIAAFNGHKDISEFLIRNKATVDSVDIKGRTPLHVVAMNGRTNIVDLLINNNAKVNVRTKRNETPLHLAVRFGHADIVMCLIENKAKVNAKDNHGLTPLHKAVIAGQTEIVKLLIKSKANVNEEDYAKQKPLMYAIWTNAKEITEVLVANGASVIGEGDRNMFAMSVYAGNKDILDILLKYKVFDVGRTCANDLLLHIAAGLGHEKIMNTLIAGGANVNARDKDGSTPLFDAAQEGHGKIVKLLIANGADPNAVNFEDETPLHMAVKQGHSYVIQVLLNNGVNNFAKAKNNITLLELAVVHDQFQVVQTLLQNGNVDLNAAGKDGSTILHLASEIDNLETVKFLVDKGCNINAESASGLKPIHNAAKEGCKDIVEFFLSKGLSVNERDSAMGTPLHFAAVNSMSEVVKYLIQHGADVNAIDNDNLTPLDIAINCGCNDIVEVLLQNGAVISGKCDMKQQHMANSTDDGNASALKHTFLQAVKKNDIADIETCIKAGSPVDIKDVRGQTPLYFAAWKGNKQVVDILLQNKAIPNVADHKGFTPMHYAAKFSHLNIVKSLLAHGAVYNPVSNGGVTPLDLVVDEGIAGLFKLIDKSFRKVKEGDLTVVDDINKIEDIDTVRAVMSARNSDNSLVVVGVHSKFSRIEHLKEVCQNCISDVINRGLQYYSQSNYPKALHFFALALKTRKGILGSDNPGTLDFQSHVASTFYMQGFYKKALEMYEEIFRKQTDILGVNSVDALKTRSSIALILHRLGEYERALTTHEETYQKQKEILGPNHPHTLDTWFNMALVLYNQGKFDKALSINKAVFEQRKIMFGSDNAFSMIVQNNIAIILNDLNVNYDEALELCKKVLEKEREVVGTNHALTLSTMGNIAILLRGQKKYHESLKAYQEFVNMQKSILGSNHPQTLTTLQHISNLLVAQGKWKDALEEFRDVCAQIIATAGSTDITDILNKMQTINLRFQSEKKQVLGILQLLANYFFVLVYNGDMPTLQFLLRSRVNVNAKDVYGRTPLHLAVMYGHTPIINMLLENGADVTQVTNKGYTTLHMATHDNCEEIVQLLLHNISPDKLNNFINAETFSNGTTALHLAAKNGSLKIVQLLLHNISRDRLNNFINAKNLSHGTTALHVAAMNGSLEIVLALLKHGAIYNIDNKKGETPFNCTNKENVSNFLKLIEENFENAKGGNIEIINKFSDLKRDEFFAITNALNTEGKTLIEVALTNGCKDIASE